MLDTKKRDMRPRERALAFAIREVVAELRLVDAVDYASYLRFEKHGNIEDIVQSASELHLKPGVLTYAGSGEVRLTWSSLPVIVLAMEFRHRGVTTHFNLELTAATASVEITYVDLPAKSGAGEDDTQQLLCSMRDAKLGTCEPAGHA